MDNSTKRWYLISNTENGTQWTNYSYDLTFDHTDAKPFSSIKEATYWAVKLKLLVHVMTDNQMQNL